MIDHEDLEPLGPPRRLLEKPDSRGKIKIPNGFAPRDYQVPFMEYFDNGGKRAVWVVHRRGGKDLTAMHQTCKMMHQRRGAYWHVFPTSEQGRKAIWEGFTKTGERIMEQVFPTAIRKSPKEFLPKAEMVVELKCGSIWRLLGSDKIEVVGAGPIGIVFSEYALAKPAAWNMIRPMLRENDGWAAFITTPRGNNHAKKLADMAAKDPTWFYDLRTLEQTRAYDPEATMAAERAEGMPEELIRQEYLCDWTAALVGSVFGGLMPEPLEFEHPRDGVYTSWDLGISDATAIWFWRVMGESVDFIDFVEANGKPFSYFADAVDERGYDYAMHWLPHDARARTFVTGGSVQEAAHARWKGRVGIVPGLSLADGIQAGRWLLAQKPRFHTRCSEGVEALKAYHYEWDEDRKVLANTPMHDWSSHPADAYRMAAIVAKQAIRIARKTEPPPPIKIPSLAEAYRLDELWETLKPSQGRSRI